MARRVPARSSRKRTATPRTRSAAAGQPAATTSKRGTATSKRATATSNRAAATSKRAAAATDTLKGGPETPARGRLRKSAATRAAEDFVRGVLARGEAAKPTKRGKLPAGVTHEIVAETDAGVPKLRRRRFSLT